MPGLVLVLELLDELHKWICRTVGPSVAACLEPFAHRRNVASLSLFYRYYFARCSSELAQVVPLPYPRARSTFYSNRLHDFSVTIPRCNHDVYVNSFFHRTARVWNCLCLSIECFPLDYDLNGFKSKIFRHLLTVTLTNYISWLTRKSCFYWKCKMELIWKSSFNSIY